MLEVRVVSLKEEPSALVEARKVFTDARVFPAVDMRGVKMDSLRDAELVSLSAHDTLRKGRKWDKELPSAGAVGLQHSVRLALGENPDVPLLLMEEDCILMSGDLVTQNVRHLLSKIDEFDVALFGAILFDGDKDKQSLFSTTNTNWYVPPHDGLVLLAHCVLYSPRGRAYLSEYLSRPMEVQIDSLLNLLHRQGKLKLIYETSSSLATQKAHISDIQDHCPLCSVSPKQHVVSLDVLFALTLVLLACLWMRKCLLRGKKQ